MDEEHKEYYYTREPLGRGAPIGDISKQLQFKKDHNCKSFKWFMENVAYEVYDKFPKLPPNKAWGEVSNTVPFNSAHDYHTESNCYGFDPSAPPPLPPPTKDGKEKKCSIDIMKVTKPRQYFLKTVLCVCLECYEEGFILNGFCRKSLQALCFQVLPSGKMNKAMLHYIIIFS